MMTMLLTPLLIDFIQIVLALVIFYLCFTVLSSRRRRGQKTITRGSPIVVNRSAQQ
ncbi:MAG: hypothetical protein SH847_00390 [Roseiflexaceae bacterium]|nr:hypothetical protein [Roseiflexaceae bacterium]